MYVCVCVCDAQPRLFRGSPGRFVVLFVLGNVVQLFGSMFIKGPIAYGKKLVSTSVCALRMPLCCICHSVCLCECGVCRAHGELA